MCVYIYGMYILQMRYSLNITSSNLEAMPHPKPSIKKDGIIPAKAEGMSHTLPSLYPRKPCPFPV